MRHREVHYSVHMLLLLLLLLTINDPRTQQVLLRLISQFGKQ